MNIQAAEAGPMFALFRNEPVSIRLRNCVLNIFDDKDVTVSRVLELSLEDLRRTPNLGKHSVKEFIDWAAKRGNGKFQRLQKARRLRILDETIRCTRESLARFLQERDEIERS